MKEILFQLLLILTSDIWGGRDSSCPAKLDSPAFEKDGNMGISSNQLPDANENFILAMSPFLC